MKLSIAIDGPAGAGKSTIAKIIADRFNLMYINTGAMYRAVTLFAIRNNIYYNDVDELCNMISKLNMHFKNESIIVNGEDISEEIRSIEISNNVSNYAAVPEVREILVELQRKMSMEYGVVMDGRDIGTVVLKEAPFKFFLTASPEERARRRCLEYEEKGIEVKYKVILDDIIKRDYIDSHRETNPLSKAEDAMEIDSSNMSISEVVEKICSIILNCTNKKNK